MFSDWVLQYGSTEYRFGPEPYPVRFVSCEFAQDSVDVDDMAVPRGDGVIFGQDRVQPGEIRISVLIDFVNAPYPAEVCARLAWEARQQLDQVWNAASLRRSTNEVATLNMGGTQMVEGRPRRARFDDSLQNVGRVTAELYFVPSDRSTYVLDEDGVSVWREVTVGLVPVARGGLKAPLKAPLSTTRESSRAEPFEVRGTSPAWGIFTVRGPLQDGASIELVGFWEAKLNRALRYDDVAVLHTKPNRGLMTLNGSPVNLLRMGGANLSDMSMNPGFHSIALRGSSSDGTASVTVRWRDTRG